MKIPVVEYRYVLPWRVAGEWPATDPIVEVLWAPILGPSAMALWRRSAGLFAEQDAVDVEMLAALLGLAGIARNRITVASHTVHRLMMFGRATPDPADETVMHLAMRSGPPTPRQRQSWPPVVRAWAAAHGLPGLDVAGGGDRPAHGRVGPDPAVLANGTPAHAALPGRTVRNPLPT